MPLPMKDKALAAGGLIGALGVASCCLLPLVLVSLGIGGGAVGSLAALLPYRTFFLWAAIGALALGFYTSYIAKSSACTGDACAPSSRKPVRAVLWVALLILSAALITEYAEQWF